MQQDVRGRELAFLAPSFYLCIAEEVAQDAAVEDALSRCCCGVEDAGGPLFAVKGMHALLGELRVLIKDVSQRKGGTVDLRLKDGSALCADTQKLQPCSYCIRDGDIMTCCIRTLCSHVVILAYWFTVSQAKSDPKKT